MSPIKPRIRQQPTAETVEVSVEYDEFGFVKDYVCPCGGNVKLSHVDSLGTKWFKCEKCGKQLTKLKSKERKDFDENIAKARELLKNPQMLDIITKEYNKYCAGEQTLLKFLHIVCTARYVKGQWVHVSGASRGGKDTVVRTVLSVFPEEDTMVALRFSEHGLEYSGAGDEVDLDGKIIYVSEQEGIKAALDTLRPLYGQKGKTLTAYTVDTSKGVKGRKLKLKGCPVLINTSIIPNMSDSTVKRFYLTSIDESVEQTKRVQKLEAYMRSHPTEYECESDMIKTIKYALSMYPKNAIVFIPYAEFIEFPSDRVRHRGDFDKFLDLIEAVAYTHLFQRQVIEKTNNGVIVIADGTDFQIAKELLKEVFTPTLLELPSPLRRFFDAIREPLKTAATEEGLTVRDIVNMTGKSEATVRSYMNKLREAGFVVKESKGKINHYYLIPGAMDKEMLDMVKLDYGAHYKEIRRRILEELKNYVKREGRQVTFKEKTGKETTVTMELIERALGG